MAVYKNITSRAIISKVMRDLQTSDGNWVIDAVEWIGEALEHIGASAQLVEKGCVLTISNYRATLPADLYYINQVAINTTISPSIENELTELITKVDAINLKLQDTASLCEDCEDPTGTLIRDLRDLNNRIIVLENIYLADGNGLQPLSYATGTFPKALHCDDCVNEVAKHKETYFVDEGVIKTSFVSGKVCLSYKAFPCDEDGYPMIPDDVSFKEAMFWYIYKKLLLGGLITHSVNGINYQFADEKWRYYCSQARNAAVYPDIDRWESFLNQWVRMIPNMNRHNTAFENLNTRERLTRSIDY
tara:strand:- start:632 stop:1540 length:909 start_codon:yes stop_codon:yes gene_type:complete